MRMLSVCFQTKSKINSTINYKIIEKLKNFRLEYYTDTIFGAHILTFANHNHNI
jgi:hypothetical protein